MNREESNTTDVEQILKQAQLVIDGDGEIIEDSLAQGLLGAVKPKQVRNFVDNPFVQKMGSIFLLGTLIYFIATFFDDSEE